MAFYVPTVTGCPVARQSKGVIEIDPEILTRLAGAVRDRDEWLVILLGERKQNGLHVIVDNYYVPRKQKRGPATCSTEEPLPESISRDVVGVVHSHNNMAAIFSATDKGEGGLNRTFPMSIVISTQYKQEDKECMLLGFAYQAEGRFTLPCGGLGVAQFDVIPLGIEDWPFKSTPRLASHSKGTAVNDLNDCAHWTEAEDSTRYDLKRIGNCGIQETAGHTRHGIFGFDGADILSRLPEAERIVYAHKRGVQGSQREGYYSLDDYFKNKKKENAIAKSNNRSLGAAGSISMDEEEGKIVIDGDDYFGDARIVEIEGEEYLFYPGEY